MPISSTDLKRFIALLGVGVLAAACQSPPPTPEPAAPVETAPAPEPVPQGPVGPAAQQQAQKGALHAADLLEAGNVDEARAELQRALATDPNNKLAQNLMRQLTADPLATLGKESFPYTVKPGETLSKISGRFMGDIYAFYILARYNDISVPRQVAAGQTIRVPGKAPPPGTVERDARKPADPRKPADAKKDTVAAPAPAPAPPPEPAPLPGEKAFRSGEAAEKAGDRDKAYAEYRRAAGLDHPDAPAKAEAMRRQLVSRHSLNARSAFAKQDLDGAIRNWDRVLELDPGNDTAKLERQKALALKEKIKSLK